MAYVNKVKKGSEEWDIQDARIPEAEQADEGKVPTVSASGEYVLATPSGGTKLYKHALAKSDFTVGADIITNSSGSLFDTEQTIISVNNVKGVAQYGGNYYIALQNYFNRAGDTIVGFSITSLLVSNLETVETLSFDGSNATETITAL